MKAIDDRYALLRQQFGTLNDWQEGELRHCAELAHLAHEARQALLQGASGISVADLSKLEDTARQSLLDLNLPPAPAPKRGPDKMEIVLVRPADTELSKQCDGLRERVADLERQLREAEVDAGRARGEAEEARGALSAAKASPSVFDGSCVVPRSNAEVLNDMLCYGGRHGLPEW
jgi:hypothetical protein